MTTIFLGLEGHGERDGVEDGLLGVGRFSALPLPLNWLLPFGGGCGLLELEGSEESDELEDPSLDPGWPAMVPLPLPLPRT